MRHIACAILYRGGAVLLGRRTANRRTYPNCWDVLGGHKDEGETIEDALIREVAEEANVTPTDFYLVGTVTDPNPELNQPATYYIYGVSGWHGGEPTMLGNEHTEIRWFEVEDACAISDIALDAYLPFFRAVEERRTIPR